MASSERRACDTLEKFERLDFNDSNNLFIIYRNILQSMADPELPVRGWRRIGVAAVNTARCDSPCHAGQHPANHAAIAQAGKRGRCRCSRQP